MKILIDALSAREGGGVTYVRQLLPELLRQLPADEIHVLLAPSYQADIIERVPEGARVIPAPLSDSGVFRRLWYEQTGLQRLVRREGFDLLYTVAEAGAMWASCPHVVLARNLSVFVSPDSFPAGRARRRAMVYRLTRQPVAYLSLRSATTVVCVSETFRDMIVRKFRLDPNRTRVVHHGVNPLFSGESVAASERPVTAGWPVSYLLTVSSVAPHKNHDVLVEAYAMAHAQLGSDLPPLLIAGGTTDRVLHAELLSLVERRGLAGHVRFLGRVDQDELPALYRGAELFLFPSRLETFGLPLLESMAAGTPAIVSDLPITREIGGDAPRFVREGDAAGLGAAIVELLGDPRRRESMSKLGRERAAGFSWESTARAMAAIFSSVVIRGGAERQLT